MSGNTTGKPESKLKQIHEIEADFRTALESTGGVKLTQRLEGCVPEIEDRLRTAKRMLGNSERSEYERYVRQLQKFVGLFSNEIKMRAETGVSLKRPPKRNVTRPLERESAFPVASPEQREKKKRKQASNERRRGFFDE